MRFITEFELPNHYDKSNEAWGSFSLERKKSNLECGIGVEMANNFGWQNPNQNDLHYKLEIEAFPMDKWLQFKKRFFDALPDYDSTSRVRLTNALEDLERFIPEKKPL